jgi:large subunit ribosomal protein L15
MQLHNLQKNTSYKKAHRVGRGGTRGKTSGRGTKGQKARAGTSGRPEMRDIIKKLPKRRGYGKNRARTVNDSVVKPQGVNLARLSPDVFYGSSVTPERLFEAGLVRRRAGRIPAIKILGTGTLTRALTFSGVSVSATAKSKIESAGGTVVV